MKESRNGKGLMVAENCAKDNDFKSTIGVEDILLDIKIIINEYYMATFTSTGNNLKVVFDNGQCFNLAVSEGC